MCPIEARQSLYSFNIGKRLVHIHRVHQRLIIPGEKLVSYNQETIRIFSNPVFNLVARKTV